MQKSIVIMNASGASTARDLAANPYHLWVRSHFVTLQGEGCYAGQRAYFIRLGGCNLGDKDKAGCRGCDTDFDIRQSKEVHVVDLADAVREARCQLVVITGGEPTLQHNLIDLVGLLEGDGREVQIETNGTQTAMLRKLALTDATVFVSPKASDRGYVSRFGNEFKDNTNFHFKFVVSADPDNHHHKLPSWAEHLDRRRLWLSPFTVYQRPYSGEVSSAWDSTLVDHAATRANYEYAARRAMEEGCNVSIQMHTWLGLA